MFRFSTRRSAERKMNAGINKRFFVGALNVFGTSKSHTLA